tara:strand:+ start:110 stop:253 length:144 start_codon:yes stop_codon:yes gene_type:complete
MKLAAILARSFLKVAFASALLSKIRAACVALALYLFEGSSNHKKTLL